MPRYALLRLGQFTLAECTFLGGLALIFHREPGSIFWPISVGLIVPTLFAEPYFTGPRLAIANSIAQVGTYFSSGI